MIPHTAGDVQYFNELEISRTVPRSSGTRGFRTSLLIESSVGADLVCRQNKKRTDQGAASISPPAVAFGAQIHHAYNATTIFQMGC